MQPPQHCNGVNVSDGMPCRRNQKLSPNGYCYQHLKQDPAYIEPVKLPNTPGPTQLLPTQILQLQQQQEKQDDRHSASIGPSGEEGGSGHNSNNEEQIERSHTDPSSVSASSSLASTSGSNSAVSKGDLPRCTAIAKTTGQQCCKRVSFAGETKCPKHGGKQIKLVSTLPMCGAISRSTRQPCQNHVTFAGQKFCAFHGGLTFRSAAMAVTPSFAPQQHQQPAIFTPSIKPQQQQQQQHNMLREEYENPRGWAEIQAQSMKYLMETHPKSQCKCSTSAEPCQGMKIVMWAQAIVQLAQQQQQGPSSSSTTASIFGAKVSDLVKFIPTNAAAGDNKNLFSDLYQAVLMFGSNIFFLPRFYQHIQHEASGQPPFVPHLFRHHTTTAVRMQLDDRESISGSGLEDEEQQEEEEANDNGGRNLDVF
jgi:hypothetical protein